ncbi:DeoR/GlpR family DNA-binding transcription regulator [Clostridium guangxiense]|uniref:DeoR/GlpR family DNA-binding transcription regulator n=1 Tax=Clostridium guangxiense TaxID=1662055 RepID=UPI001E4D796C|nr:DeoR/GlpR family DNA-binding transcription regulator [Clostridium guangxiense]MCD2345728.1 DeoR/GlpR family DNA-binding transcription regulator [Clostridium guangxiense]
MKSDRIRKIEEYIISNEVVSLDTLCEVFNISKNTVRRDINDLVEKGSIKKVYGGVTVNSDFKNSPNGLVSFEERNIRNNEAKISIGKAAASFVQDNDIIFIDSGTTTLHMIEYLKDIKNVTILTNNINAIAAAIPFENLNIICLGGSLIRKTNSFEGIRNFEIFKDYNINKAFMAATGISLSSGATNSSPLEYKIKKNIVEKSKEVYLLADDSKFNISALMTYCKLSDIDHLITNTEPPKEYLNYFNENNVKYTVSQ